MSSPLKSRKALLPLVISSILLLSSCSATANAESVSEDVNQGEMKTQVAETASDYYGNTLANSRDILDTSQAVSTIFYNSLGEYRFVEVYDGRNADTAELFLGLDRIKGNELTRLADDFVSSNPLQDSIHFGELNDRERIVANQLIMEFNTKVGITLDVYGAAKAQEVVIVSPDDIDVTGGKTAVVDAEDVIPPLTVGKILLDEQRDLPESAGMFADEKMYWVKIDGQWMIDAETMMKSMYPTG